MDATFEQIREAIGTLSKKDLTKSQVPKMGALNAALTGMGLDKISAEQRDLAMAGAEDAPTGKVTVTLLESDQNPVIMYVYGVGQFEIRVGETKELPQACLDALDNAPVVYKKD